LTVDAVFPLATVTTCVFPLLVEEVIQIPLLSNEGQGLALTVKMLYKLVKALGLDADDMETQ